MSDKAILIGFEFIITSAFLVAACALLLAEWFVLSLFPLAVAVLIGGVIIDSHLFGRRRRSRSNDGVGAEAGRAELEGHSHPRLLDTAVRLRSSGL